MLLITFERLSIWLKSPILELERINMAGNAFEETLIGTLNMLGLE